MLGRVSCALAMCGACSFRPGVLGDVRDGDPSGGDDSRDSALAPALLYGHDQTRLVTINPATSMSRTVTMTLSGGGPCTLEELAVDGAGVIVAQSDALDELYTVDADTGVCTPLVALSSGTTRAFRGMTFVEAGATDFPGERLLGRDTAGQLFDLDRTTGMVTEIGNYAGPYDTRGDITWVAGTGLVASSDITNQTGDALVLVDPRTAATSVLIGDTGLHYIYGLGVLGGHLFALVGTSGYAELDPGTGALIGGLKSVSTSLTWSGGGAQL